MDWNVKNLAKTFANMFFLKDYTTFPVDKKCCYPLFSDTMRMLF